MRLENGSKCGVSFFGFVANDGATSEKISRRRPLAAGEEGGDCGALDDVFERMDFGFVDGLGLDVAAGVVEHGGSVDVPLAADEQ